MQDIGVKQYSKKKVNNLTSPEITLATVLVALHLRTIHIYNDNNNNYSRDNNHSYILIDNNN